MRPLERWCLFVLLLLARWELLLRRLVLQALLPPRMGLSAGGGRLPRAEVGVRITMEAAVSIQRGELLLLRLLLRLLLPTEEIRPSRKDSRRW